MIRLAAGAYEFKFEIMIFHLSGSEVAKHIALGAQFAGYSFGDFNTAAHGNKIYILGMAVQEKVSHISPHHIAFTVDLIGN